MVPDERGAVSRDSAELKQTNKLQFVIFTTGQMGFASLASFIKLSA